MLHAGEGMARAAHRVARFEQRLIEALAVISDQHVEAREICGERVQHRRLLAVIPHEELADAKTFARSMLPTPIRNAQVPEPPASPVVSVSRKAQVVGWARGMAPAESESRRSCGEFDQIGDFVTAVAFVAGVELLGFEVFAEGRFDDFAGEELFDESGGIAVRFAAGRRRGKPGIFTVNAGDGLAKMGQLFRNIHVRRLFAFHRPFVPY